MEREEFENTIRLTNEGNLEFFFIGVGSAFSKINFQNNFNGRSINGF